VAKLTGRPVGPLKKSGPYDRAPAQKLAASRCRTLIDDRPLPPYHGLGVIVFRACVGRFVGNFESRQRGLRRSSSRIWADSGRYRWVAVMRGAQIFHNLPATILAGQERPQEIGTG